MDSPDQRFPLDIHSRCPDGDPLILHHLSRFQRKKHYIGCDGNGKDQQVIRRSLSIREAVLVFRGFVDHWLGPPFYGILVGITFISPFILMIVFDYQKNRSL